MQDNMLAFKKNIEINLKKNPETIKYWKNMLHAMKTLILKCEINLRTRTFCRHVIDTFMSPCYMYIVMLTSDYIYPDTFFMHVNLHVEFLFCILTYIVYIKCTQELTYGTIWSIFWNVFNLCEAINSLLKINIELQIFENVLLDFRQIHTVFFVTYIGGSFNCKRMKITNSEIRQHRVPKTVITIIIQSKAIYM